MTRHLQNLHFQSEKSAARCLFDEKIRGDWLQLQLEADTAKEFPVGNHRRRRGMAADRTTKTAFQFGNVRDMIKMSVGQEEQLQLNSEALDPIAGAVWRVK